MRALRTLGRNVEALDAYDRLRRRLIDALGVEPAAELQSTYLELLRTELVTTPAPVAMSSPAAPATPATGPAPASPRCLPLPPQRLVGREYELQHILAALHVNRARPRMPHVVVINGMAGIGKTALALTVAHAVADRFPDSHLFVDLHGHSEQRPVSTHEALETLLQQLDSGSDATSEQRPNRIALWRHRLHGRRGIVLLDNAAGTTQVGPLLQLDGPSLFLVTSRTWLAPIDGATEVSLDLLDPRNAVALLRHTAGQRVADDPAAASAIVELCGRLPLAIRLVGHRLRHRPRWSAAMMHAQLATAARAPITISVEGHSTAAAFELSYRQLPERQQLLFRRLGLHPAGTVEVWAAAALADLPEQDTNELLDRLVEVNLVQADIPGRYRMHDLIRAFAATLVTDDERRPATVRMLDGYLHTLEAAGRHLETVRQHTDAPTPPAHHGPAFSTVADGAAWAYANWSTIVALVNMAVQAGAHRHTVLLTRMAHRSAEAFGRSTEALRLAQQALAAADALGDDELAAEINRLAGVFYLRLGRNADCRASIDRAIHLYRGLGNEHMAYTMQTNKIILLQHEGRHLEAIRMAAETLSLARARREPYNEALALIAGAASHHQIGQHETARRMLIDAVRHLRHHNKAALGVALGWLGSVHIALHQPAAAAIALTWAIALKRQHGNIGGAAETLSDYGRLLAGQGNPEAALQHQQQAYEQAGAIGDGYYEPIIANHLGETLTMLGRYDEALTFHRRAYRTAERRHFRYEQARAQAGIAAASRHTDPDEADAVQAGAVTELTAIGLDLDAAHAMCNPQGKAARPASTARLG